MRFIKIFGACLITVGIALLALQITWMVSGQGRPQSTGKNAAHDYMRTPYAGIVGVALIVGGIGFVFMARHQDEPRSRRSIR
jgi:hypothetical protein